MRILMGSLGKLGFLVRNVTRDGANREWSIVPDESALSGFLSAAELSADEARGALRQIRQEGRTIVSLDDARGAALLTAGR